MAVKKSAEILPQSADAQINAINGG